MSLQHPGQAQQGQPSQNTDQGRPHLPQRQSQQAQPLAQLQGLLNIVLMTIGSTLNDPKRFQDPHSSQTRINLQVIPQATHRFHEALDKLEQDVKKAQMIMRRDYGSFLQEKERREADEKARIAAAPVPLSVQNTVMPSIEEPVKMKEEDTVMKDTSVQAATASVPNGQTKQEENPTADIPAASSNKIAAIDQRQETDQAMDSLLADANAVVDELGGNDLGVDDLFGNDDVADLPNDGTANMDLDAMFGLGSGTTPNVMNATPGGADGLTTDALNSQPLGNGDIDLSFEDAGQGPALAGLEDYANMDSDAANTGQNGNGDVNMDLPDLDFSNLGDLGPTQPATNGDTSKPADEQPKINGDINGTQAPLGLDFGDASAVGGEQQIQADNFDDFFSDLMGDASMGDIGAQGDLGQNTEGDDWSWLNG